MKAAESVPRLVERGEPSRGVETTQRTLHVAGKQKLRIALVADGPPADRHTNSGVAHGILQALAAHPLVSDVVPINGRLRGVWKALVALATVRSSRSAWRSRYLKGPLAVHVRSWLVEREIARQRPSVDVVLLLRNVYRPLKTPYVVFLDTTAVLTQHSWPPWALSRAMYAWRIRADRAQFRAAAHVFTAGRYVADHVVRDYGIPRDQVSAIGGGVNYRVSSLPQWEPSQDPTILYVGHDFQRKGGDVLVESFARVRKVFPTARLLLVGRETRSRTHPQGVLSLGDVDDRDALSQIYSKATVFCLPARFEPYGLVLQEALAHGVPCVGTKVGAIPEILENGRLGLLVDLEDVDGLAETLIRLLSDAELRRSLSGCGRAEVSTSGTWDAVADRLVRTLGKRPS